MIELIVNGDCIRLPEKTTVAELLEHLDLPHRRVAVEVNLEIVPKSEHSGYKLNQNDRIEIVHAMGGG